MAAPSAFERLTLERSVAKRRIIVNLTGEDKRGKTHYVLQSAPEPVYYIVFDPNGEELAKRMVRTLGRTIYITRMQVERGAGQVVWKKEWQAFLDAHDEALRVNKGTLFIDTGTEVYELRRLAEFGRESNVAHLYGPVNRDIRALFKAEYASDMSAVWAHKMRDEYVNDKKTGGREPSMWAGMPFEVQANLEARYNPRAEGHKFSVFIHNDNLNMELAGQEYTTDFFTFQFFLETSLSAS